VSAQVSGQNKLDYVRRYITDAKFNIHQIQFMFEIADNLYSELSDKQKEVVSHLYEKLMVK